MQYESGSVYQWRSGGERHMFNPQTVLHCGRPAAKTITLCSNAFPRTEQQCCNQNLRSMLTFTPAAADTYRQ
ncbi:MAG: hypothetical protein ACLRXQ_07895 [Phascolarctobacterium faecium]